MQVFGRYSIMNCYDEAIKDNLTEETYMAILGARLSLNFQVDKEVGFKLLRKHGAYLNYLSHD